jgi:hypothetical protein
MAPFANIQFSVFKTRSRLARLDLCEISHYLSEQRPSLHNVRLLRCFPQIVKDKNIELLDARKSRIVGN